MIQTGKLVVNPDTRTVTADGKPIHLTRMEYGVLELLCLRKGTIVTKAMLLHHLYGGFDEPELRIIDNFVSALRKKLVRATGGQHYIETVWGRGHIIRAPSDAAAADQRSPAQWTPRRKAEVVAAVKSKEMTLDDALRRYQLTKEEFREWRRLYDAYGLPGLRTTRTQQYHPPPPRRRRGP
jgi:DNA-binding winged helix-turn-helix (wHTH) protein